MKAVDQLSMTVVMIALDRGFLDRPVQWRRIATRYDKIAEWCK
jgi:hypothetical protein